MASANTAVPVATSAIIVIGCVALFAFTNPSMKSFIYFASIAAFLVFLVNLRLIPITPRLIIVAAIGFIIAFAIPHWTMLQLALLILALVVIPIPKILRGLLILAVIGSVLLAPPMQSLYILSWLGIALGVLALGLLPAPWLGYDGFFLYSWLEESYENCGDDDDSGDGDGGD